MMKTWAACLGALILLCGCTSTEYWCHSTLHGGEAFRKANFDCRGEAYKRAYAAGKRGDDDFIEMEWRDCMKIAGWHTCTENGERRER
jgi:hypothetical protein